MKKILIALVVIALVAAVAVFFIHRSKTDRIASLLSGGGEPASVSANAPLDLSFCDDTLAATAGTLCAIKPSGTDPRIKDIYGTSAKGDAAIGFGYHAVAVPDDWANVKGVWVHFIGTSGRPYDQRRDAFGNEVWLDELMEAGYLAVELAYDNRFSVNGDLCGARNEGHDRDNCAGEVREVNLTGEGSSPYRSTDAYNTIDYRLAAVLRYLVEHGVDLPDDIDPDDIDWGKLSVSGHSQGANQAYYIAKKRPVEFACILAGGYDTADTVNPGPFDIADWFTEGESATPISRIGAVLATADDSYNAFYQGLTKVIGLPEDRITISDQKTFVDEDGVEQNGHGGTVKDPSLKEARAQACFR